MSLSRGVDFKSSDEVKEYLENLGIEYRFGCYHEKNPEICHLLGEYMEIVMSDKKKALKIFETNCEINKNGQSCHRAGIYHYQGRLGDRNEDLGYDYFKKGCESKYFDSCANVGMVHLGLNETGRSKNTKYLDPAKALRYFYKACDEGNIGEACHQCSVLNLNGADNVIPVNLKKAFEYAQKACERDHTAGCVNLSLMYRRGDGTKKDEEMAKKIASIAREKIAEEKGQRGTLNFGGPS